MGAIVQLLTSRRPEIINVSVGNDVTSGELLRRWAALSVTGRDRAGHRSPGRTPARCRVPVRALGGSQHPLREGIADTPLFLDPAPRTDSYPRPNAGSAGTAGESRG